MCFVDYDTTKMSFPPPGVRRSVVQEIPPITTPEDDSQVEEMEQPGGKRETDAARIMREVEEQLSKLPPRRKTKSIYDDDNMVGGGPGSGPVKHDPKNPKGCGCHICNMGRTYQMGRQTKV